MLKPKKPNLSIFSELPLCDPSKNPEYDLSAKF
jgi:hypothetical protein